MEKIVIIKEEKSPYFAEMEYSFSIDQKEEGQVVELAKTFIEKKSGKDGYWLENEHEANENTFIYYDQDHEWVGFFRKKAVAKENNRPVYAALVAI